MKASFEEQIIWDRYQLNRKAAPGLKLTYGFRIFGNLNVSRLDSALRKTVEYFSDALLNSFYDTKSGLQKKRISTPQNVLHIYDKNANLTSEVCENQIDIESGRLFYFAAVPVPLGERDAPPGNFAPLGVLSSDVNLDSGAGGILPTGGEKMGGASRSPAPGGELREKILTYLPPLGATIGEIMGEAEFCWYCCIKLMLCFSHIAFDGLSYEPFIKKLSEFYNTENAYSSPNFSQVLEEEADGAEYFKEKISQIAPCSKLPFIKSEGESGIFVTKHAIQGEELSELKKFCEREKATQFQVIAAVLGIALHKYCDDNKAFSYTATTNKAPDRVGCYLNILPLNFQCNENSSIEDCVNFVKKERGEVRQFQKFPFKKIMKFVSAELYNTLFDVILNDSNGLLPQKYPVFSDCYTELVDTPDLSSPCDLSLTYSKSSEEIILAFSASTDKIDPGCLEEFKSVFIRTLTFVLQNPISTKIQALDICKNLTPALVGRKLKISPKDTVVEHFLKNVKRDPGKIAISCNRYDVTYSELNNLRTRIIQKLCQDTDSPVAFLLNRTELIPAVMLASLSLGRPYVPIDTKLPNDRIRYILDSSASKVLVTDDENYSRSCGFKDICDVVNISKLDEIEKSENKVFPANFTAYILFTSGSTGKPKGVAVTHRNLINFMYSMLDTLDIDSKSRFIPITSVGFDISVLELILPLFVGASVKLIDEETVLDLRKLGDIINESCVNILQATPATFRGLRSINWSSENDISIICGGEALDNELAKYLLSIGSSVYNVYGPTETTVWSSIDHLTQGGTIAIGTPIYNTKYFIVDKDFRSVPMGKPGQLLIAGDCVSNGYVNAPNSDNFIKVSKISGRVYCTGDIVKQIGENDIVYVGRADNQYKINGHRIDLSEVSKALLEVYANIDFFVVVRKGEKPYDKHVVCFYANDLDHIFDAKVCKEYLKRKLPYYMLPAGFYELKNIPKNINGKADVKFLSEANFNEIDLSKNIPLNGSSNPIEGRICEILRKTFNIDTSNLDIPLGVLGLDSIMYTQLSDVLDRDFNLKIQPHEFYKFSTLGDLVLYISGRRPKIQPEKSSQKHEKCDVCILGMSVLLPQNLNKEEFWDALLSQKDLISLPPEDRHFSSKFKCGYLSDIDAFDSAFFSISRLEASNMDPRQKRLLQIAWETLEDAGISKNDLANRKVGCYIATTGGDYNNNQNQNVYSLTGRAMSILSNRISRYFNWRGPSITIDTACSGSLVALGQAYNDIINGICDFAFVGSANIFLDESNSEALKIGNFLSPNFRCAAFDQSADGYVRSEGICGILLSRSDIVHENEYDEVIRGTVKSAALGHGGRSNSLTAPNIYALSDLYTSAYDTDLRQNVTYIETHGTGTKLGDPIEITSLKNVFSKECGHDIYLGAVKSNIGHLESSAGLASVAKVLLSFEHKMLAANIHFHQLNKEINLEDTPFKVLEKNTAWDFCENRIAGVSSFGFGGMNAHVVLQEHKKQNTDNDSEEIPYIITVSARSERSVTEYSKKLYVFLKREKANLKLRDIAYTLAVGRTHFEYRAAVIAKSIDELMGKLEYLQISFVPSGRLVRTYNEKFISNDINEVFSKFLEGEEISWIQFFEGQGCRRIHLPTYVFGKNFIREGI